MAKPVTHAASSARRYGGKWEDYFPLHDLIDSSKGAIADNRHRALTHNSWFISNVIEKVYMPEKGWHGPVLINSQGRQVSTRQLAEDHILEDFGGRFIPAASDYLQEIEMKDWMNNGLGGATPPTFAKIAAKERRKRHELSRTSSQVGRPQTANEGRSPEPPERILEGGV